MAASANAIVEANLQRAAQVYSSGRGGLLAILREADQNLSTKLHGIVRRAGGPNARFSEASAYLYRKQIRLVNEYLEKRVLGFTHDQAMAAVAANVRSTVRLAKRLEQRFTGITRPLALEAVSMQDEITRGMGASLLQQHRNSVARYGQAMINDFERVLRVGALEGMSQHQVISRIVRQGALGGINAAGLHLTEPAWFPDPTSYVRRRYWAERIVRTETAYAHNAAGLQTIQTMRNTDFPDMQKKILAHFDNRTAPDSIAVHGQVRPVHGYFLDGAGRSYLHPPARPNDRETVVPWRPDWPDVPATEPPPTQAVVDAKQAIAAREQKRAAAVAARAQVKAERAERKRLAAERRAREAKKREARLRAKYARQIEAERQAREAAEHAADLMDPRLAAGLYRATGMSADPTRMAARLREVFGAKAPGPDWWPRAFAVPKGYQLKPGHFSISGDGVSWSTTITDDRNRFVGQLARSFRRERGKLMVHHDLLKIEEDVHKRAGIGGSILAHGERWYEKLGVQQIDVDTAWDGKVVWAHHGFEWRYPGAGPDYKRRFRDHLVNQLNVDPQEADRAIRKMKHPRDVMAFELNSPPEKPKRPSPDHIFDHEVGRHYMRHVGTSWSGKITRNGGESHKIWKQRNANAEAKLKEKGTWVED